MWFGIWPEVLTVQGSKVVDQTRGILTYVDENCPGCFHEGVQYVSVSHCCLPCDQSLFFDDAEEVKHISWPGKVCIARLNTWHGQLLPFAFASCQAVGFWIVPPFTTGCTIKRKISSVQLLGTITSMS